MREPHSFPTVTQYASPELIEAIAYGDHDPGNDPRWQESGAPCQAEYARWCRHICGIACFRMALHHRDGHAPPLFELLDGARKYGAYVAQDDGTIKGMIYAPFAHYAREVHNVHAQVHGKLPMQQLLEFLDDGRMVMASVHKEIRRPHQPAPGQGGHMVLVTGHHNGTVAFRNPSGHTDAARSSKLPVETFATFYGGRGISISGATSVTNPPATDERRAVMGLEPAADYDRRMRRL